MKKLRVGLVGYYGWGNYGDEFFKEVLEKELPDFEFRTAHDVAPDGALVLDNLEANVDSVDVMMIGGGDLVIPYALSPLYWRDEFLRRPVVIYGVGVPKWGGYDQNVAMTMRTFFQHPSVKFVTARDEESRDWIETHLKPGAPLGCEPDIVCAYSHRYVVPKGRVFGLVLRHQGNDLNKEAVRTVLDTARSHGYHPRVLMLATDKTLFDDFQQIPKLDLGDVDIVVRSSVELLTDELIACDKVASMKFHGCVVSMSHNVPCLALSQANKFKNFYTELDCLQWLSSLNDPMLADKLKSLLDAPGFSFPEEVRSQARRGIAELGRQLERAASGRDAQVENLGHAGVAGTNE